MLLKTNRLIAEYFNINDISDWAEIESDANVRRFVDGKVLSLKEAGEYVELNIQQYQTHEFGMKNENNNRGLIIVWLMVGVVIFLHFVLIPVWFHFFL